MRPNLCQSLRGKVFKLFFAKSFNSNAYHRMTTMWNCLQSPSRSFASLSLTLRPPSYSVEAVANASRVITMLTKHNVNLSSTPVSIIIWKWIRAKALSLKFWSENIKLNFLSQVEFHIVMLTVTN